MPKGQHTLVDRITPYSFCGETFYALDIACIKPTFTQPTSGEHDFNTCKDCQDTLQRIAKQIEKKFARFPNCCENHRQLLKESWFKKEDYKDIAELVSTKVVYTQQHIINNIGKGEWYEDITNYIEYTAHSFGQFKHLGGLYLSDYLNYVDHFLFGNEAEFTPQKTKQLMDYLLSISKPDKSTATDFNILLATYERWLKLMPFEISFFSSAKDYFQKELPLLKEKPVYNPYLGTSRSRMHTKSSLFDLLLVRTNELLTTVNTYVLNKEGLLQDTDKIRLEIALAERRNKLHMGYINSSNDEDTKFRKILKEWFKDEKRFIDDIAVTLKKEKEGKKPKVEFIDWIDMVKGQQNFFWKGMPVEVAINHFKILTERKSKNGKPFLSNEQFIRFIEKGFLGDEKHPKQTINLSNGEKGFVIKRFYEFFELAVREYNELNKKFKYVKLVSDCFSNWEIETVEPFFKPNKTKENW